MSLEHEGEPDETTVAERLADLTGESMDTFKYDGAIPGLDELERESIEE